MKNTKCIIKKTEIIVFHKIIQVRAWFFAAIKEKTANLNLMFFERVNYKTLVVGESVKKCIKFLFNILYFKLSFAFALSVIYYYLSILINTLIIIQPCVFTNKNLYITITNWSLITLLPLNMQVLDPNLTFIWFLIKNK